MIPLCRKGLHAMTPDNILQRRNGHGNVTNSCRACRNDNNRQREARRRAEARKDRTMPAEDPTPGTTTVCAKGLHPMTPGNIVITTHKGREVVRCRECKRLAEKERSRNSSRQHRAKVRAKAPTLGLLETWLEYGTPPQPLVRTRPEGWPNSWILRHPGDDIVHRLWWGDHHLGCGADILLVSTAAPAGLPPCQACWGAVIGDGATDVGAFRMPSGQRRTGGVRPVPDSAVTE